jgi:hypothetical protein
VKLLTNKEQPVLTLLLLTLTYGILGWRFTVPLTLPLHVGNLGNWLGTLTIVLMMATIVSSPVRFLSWCLSSFHGGTDLRALIFVLGTNVMAVLMFTWLIYLVDISVALLAGLLASFDLHATRCSRYRRWGILVTCQLVGVAIGWFCRQYGRVTLQFIF